MAPDLKRSRNTLIVAASLLVIAVACVVTAACTEPGSPVREPGPSLAGTSWTLDSYIAGNGTLVPALAGTEVTASFSDDGSLTGSAGCNSYGTIYHLDGANLSIEPPGSTKMYCSEPPGIMEQENRYLALLTEVASVRLEGNRLILTDADGTDLLFFEQATSSPELSPVGTEWVLQGYISPEKEAISSVIAGTTVTATFTSGGNLTGSAGCNRYGGGYTLDGANLSVSSLFSTLIYCEEPEGVMDQEALYLGLLEDVSSWRLEGGRLILTDADGTDLLFFEQAQVEQES
jgi:heat shock protein HslJ